MLILFGSPSSIKDILRNLSKSPGYSAEILYNRQPDLTDRLITYNIMYMIFASVSPYVHMSLVDLIDDLKVAW